MTAQKYADPSSNASSSEHLIGLLGDNESVYTAKEICQLTGRPFSLLQPNLIATADSLCHRQKMVFELAKEQGARRVTLLAIGNTAMFALSLALCDRRLFRRVLLFNPTETTLAGGGSYLLSALPVWAKRGYEKLPPEESLISEIHQLTLPVFCLLASSSPTDELIKKSRDYSLKLASHLPCCWIKEISSSDCVGPKQNAIEELQTVMNSFFTLPLRRPQKNLKSLS